MKALRITFSFLTGVTLCLIGAFSFFDNVALGQTSCPILPTDTGTVTLPFSVTEDATYTAWTLMNAPDTTNNSYWLQVDDQCGMVIGDSNTLTPNTWTWVGYRDSNPQTLASVSLTSGSHILHLYGREPLVKIDKLLFISDGCVPSDSGDNCLTQPTATAVPATPTAIPQTPTLTQILTPTLIPPTPTPTITSTTIIDTTPPSVVFVTPKNGSLVARKSSVSMTANATDASGIAKVEFYVNEVLTCTDTSVTYSCSFRTSAVKGTQYNLSAKAYDKKNNAATTTISITTK